MEKDLMQGEQHLKFRIQHSDGEVEEVVKRFSGPLVIGRRSELSSQFCDLFLDDPDASRRHCRLFQREGEPDQWYLEDLGSHKGTRLNDRPVVEVTPCLNGQEIRVATTRITFFSQTSSSDLGNRNASPLDDPDAPLKDNEEADQAETVVAEGTATLAEEQSTVLAEGVTLAEEQSTVVADADRQENMAAKSADDKPPHNTKKNTASKRSRRTRRKRRGPDSGEVKAAAKKRSVAPSFEGFPVVRDLVEANLLEPDYAVDLLERVAEGNGDPFFRLLSKDRSVKFLDKVVIWVAERLGLGVLNNEDELQGLVKLEEWLPIQRATEMGIIMLDPETADRVLYGTIDPFDIETHDWVERCAEKPADKVMIHPNVFFPTLRRLKDRPPGEEDSIGLVIDITKDEE
ncbi:MAG: FHA domain-containing protein, partial [Magnetococcales bacterium]|nr:FHA domain-containing protein [Magnetococcales bacterium]